MNSYKLIYCTRYFLNFHRCLYFFFFKYTLNTCSYNSSQIYSIMFSANIRDVCNLKPMSSKKLFMYDLLLIYTGVQPVSNLQAFGERKRSISYIFTASPTSGASYKVTIIPQRAGIPQPPTETFSSASLRTKSGLVPDVNYRIQVVAVLNGVNSTAIHVNVTTLPEGKPWQLYWH